MRKETLAAFSSVAAILAGCGAERDTVEVKNISKVPIPLSDNPNAYSIEHRTGELEVGSTALASCVDVVAGFPENTKLYVKQGTEAGYVGVYSASSKTTPGKQQLTPGVDELETTLPDC